MFYAGGQRVVDLLQPLSQLVKVAHGNRQALESGQQSALATPR